MAIASVNGVRLNYRLEEGRGETVVLVNGLADDLQTWDLQIPALVEAGYTVLRFDNRGIGGSDKPAGPYTTRLLADDTRALVEHLGICRPHVVGVSMGGMIAQEYAIAHSTELRSVTLACTYAAPGPFCSRMFAFWADLAKTSGLDAVMRDVLLWLFTLDFFEQRGPELAEFEAALGSLPQPIDAYLAQLASIQTHDTTARIGAITTPTLVLAGDSDILIPVALSRRMFETIPEAEWATVPGGHACLWEHPAPFNQTVIDFLRRH